jgi:hypothetical protein
MKEFAERREKDDDVALNTTRIMNVSIKQGRIPHTCMPRPLRIIKVDYIN